MFTTNPFAELSAFISSGVIQAYIVSMIVLVVAGTLYDVVHKKSARYFVDNWRNETSKGSKQVSGGEIASMAVKTLLVEVLMSAEFCNARRKIAHLLTMYGFVIYLIATIVMVFNYPTSATPAPGIWAFLWHLGALSVCVGGYWFWFFIRVDVAAEGNSPFRLIRADLFVLSLLASVTLGLLWSWTQGSVFGWVCFAFYVLATTVLFAGVPWSKFAHMFFKPAAALQKRVAEADGSMDNLPPPADEPEQYGLGIKRVLPRNY
jgi:hypothetical protein